MNRNSFWIIGLTVSLITCALTDEPEQQARRAYREALREAVQQHDRQKVYALAIQPDFLRCVLAAAKQGDDEQVIELFQHYTGQGLDELPKGHTALMSAAWFGNVEIVNALLARKPDVNAKDETGNTALHFALQLIDNSEVVKALLARGANVDAKTKSGTTPSMLAAVNKRSENLRALLARRADVNATNNDGQTALMLAAKNGRLDNVLLLLDRGAKAKVKDKKGKTAQDYAENGMAPWQSMTDSPGFLTEEAAKEKAAQAASDQRAIIEIIKRAKR